MSEVWKHGRFVALMILSSLSCLEHLVESMRISISYYIPKNNEAYTLSYKTLSQKTKCDASSRSGLIEWFKGASQSTKLHLVN